MRSKSLFFLMVVSTLFAQGLKASDFNSSSEVLSDDACLSAELIQDIQRDFKITYEEGDKEFKVEACDKNSLSNRLIRGLALLKYGRFDPAVKSTDEIFFNEFGEAAPYEFVTKRIRGIVLVKKCDDSVVASAAKGDPNFYVCVDNFALKLQEQGGTSPLEFAVTAVHESRHTDQNDEGHFTCNHGRYEGYEGGCDRDRAQKGAYHYGTEFYAQTARYGKNFHPAVIAGARAGGLFTLLNHFNVIPKLSIQRSVFLKNYDGTLLQLKPNAQARKLGNFKGQTLFSRNDGNLLLFNPDNMRFTSWSLYGGSGEAQGSFAVEYNAISPPKAAVLDYISMVRPGNLVSAIIIGHSLSFGIYGEKKLEAEGGVNLQFEPRRFLKPSFCHGSVNHVYILANDQRVYEGSTIAPNELAFKEISGCETGFLNIIDLNGQALGLDLQGRLLEKRGDGWVPLSQFSQDKFDFMSEPIETYEFFVRP